MPANESQKKPIMDQLIQYIDYHYCVLCLACGSKVLDPDKKKGQKHFQGKCPSCGQESKVQQKSKKERKAERRAQKERERTANCRAKY